MSAGAQRTQYGENVSSPSSLPSTRICFSCVATLCMASRLLTLLVLLPPLLLLLLLLLLLYRLLLPVTWWR